MKRLSIGIRPATDGSGRTFRTITLDPWPDATPEQLGRQLGIIRELTRGPLVDFETNGRHVTLVVTSFQEVRLVLRTVGVQLRLVHILPES